MAKRKSRCIKAGCRRRSRRFDSCRTYSGGYGSCRNEHHAHAGSGVRSPSFEEKDDSRPFI
jgi:hypothetical protein